MDTVWERLTSPRRGPPGTPSVIDPVPAPGDRHGVHLYADFTECLDDHKGHAFAGIAAFSIPLSIYKKSVTPVVIGCILGFLPDLIYANWRCDAQYKTFKRHMAATMASHAALAKQTGQTTQ